MHEWESQILKASYRISKNERLRLARNDATHCVGQICKAGMRMTVTMGQDGIS